MTHIINLSLLEKNFTATKKPDIDLLESRVKDEENWLK